MRWFLLWLCLALPSAAASPAVRISGAPWPERAVLGSPGWAVADLDGDQQPDSADSRLETRDTQGYHYRVELSLSATVAKSFVVTARDAWGLRIAVRDVDGDHDLDLVITGGLDNRPVAVWINDGYGEFAEGDPSRYPRSIWRDELTITQQPRTTGFVMALSPERRTIGTLVVSGALLGTTPSCRLAAGGEEAVITDPSSRHPYLRAPPLPRS